MSARHERGSRRGSPGHPLVVGMRSDGRFPKSARILHRWEFQRIQREGVRVRTPAFTTVARASLAGRPRLGMAVSRKIGSAVTRNRIKRLLREIFRRTVSTLPAVDLVMIAHAEAGALARGGLEAMAEAVLPAMGRAAHRALQPKRSKG